MAVDNAREAAEAMDAFLALMEAPDVTYRVESEVEMGSADGGEPAFTLTGWYDVAADDYAGRLSGKAVMLENPRADAYVVSFQGETHSMDPISQAWRVVEGAAVLHRPTALAGLRAQDMVFLGRTADGLLEFDIRRWLFGDPVGTWTAIRDLGDEELPSTAMESHRTRLLLDVNGTPAQLRSSWTFTTDGKSNAAQGSLVLRFSAFGLYVSITGDFGRTVFGGTSHDVIDGVEGANVIVREPWFEVGPAAGEPSAEIAVATEYTGDKPVMLLGLEGAVLFVSSHDAGGALVLDATAPFEGGVVVAPVGDQTVSAYFRTCSGSCAVLDPPTDFCTVTATLEAGARYDLSVVVSSTMPLAARCILTLDG